MRKLKVEDMGTAVQGVTLRGRRSNPEPESFRVRIPGATIDVVRARDEDGSDYWIHVSLNGENEREALGVPEGRLVDARVDLKGKHASETDAGDLASPDLYHLAVRIGTA